MTEHAGCILAIVGSRDCHPNAVNTIAAVIFEHQPLVIVSGGAKPNASSRARKLVSIDEEAAKAARAQEIQMLEFLPTQFHFQGPGGFAERNMKIADLCMCLVRIASTTSTTYGSGWTADYAERQGKEVTRYIIDEQGHVTEGNHQPERRA